jgi:hypothetical protein
MSSKIGGTFLISVQAPSYPQQAVNNLVIDKRGIRCYILYMKGRKAPALFYCPQGSSWAVGIQSDDPKEIESQDFSWYNHGAYNGELVHMSERFAYIWTTEENYKKYLYNSSLAYLLGKYGNKFKEKIRRYARLLARLRFNSLVSEPFIKHTNCSEYSVAPIPVGNGGRSANSGSIGADGMWKMGAGVHFMGV